jgi:amidohydrolase
MKSATRDWDLSLLLRRITDEIPVATALRHAIHRDPQLSGQEWPTAEAVLAALGPVEHELIAETGLLVRIGPATGPAVGIRAELDGLPVLERSGSSFSSENGAMHACGHDIHIAGAVALARAAMLFDLPIALVFIFQPREETYPSGARDIMETGALERHGVRSVVGVHVHPGIPVGFITTGSGVVNAASDEFKIVVDGDGGHAAYPHLTTDTIVAMAQIISAAQTIVSRRIDPMHPAVLTFSLLNSGTAANVIPASSTASGSIRSSNEQDRAAIARDLDKIVSLVANANGCTARMEITRGEPVLCNDAELVEHVDRVLSEHNFEVMEPMRSCGSDDFSFYSEKYPSLMMFLGTGTALARNGLSLHSPDFCPGDESISAVAFAFASAYQAAVQMLTTQDLTLAAMKSRDTRE